MDLHLGYHNNRVGILYVKHTELEDKKSSSFYFTHEFQTSVGHQYKYIMICLPVESDFP